MVINDLCIVVGVDLVIYIGIIIIDRLIVIFSSRCVIISIGMDIEVVLSRVNIV